MSGCVGGSQQAYVSCLEDCTCLATTAYAQYCHAAFEMNASTSARERERERERDPGPGERKTEAAGIRSEVRQGSNQPQESAPRVRSQDETIQIRKP